MTSASSAHALPPLPGTYIPDLLCDGKHELRVRNQKIIFKNNYTSNHPFQGKVTLWQTKKGTTFKGNCYRASDNMFVRVSFAKSIQGQ